MIRSTEATRSEPRDRDRDATTTRGREDGTAGPSTTNMLSSLFHTLAWFLVCHLSITVVLCLKYHFPALLCCCYISSSFLLLSIILLLYSTPVFLPLAPVAVCPPSLIIQVRLLIIFCDLDCPRTALRPIECSGLPLQSPCLLGASQSQSQSRSRCSELATSVLPPPNHESMARSYLAARLRLHTPHVHYCSAATLSCQRSSLQLQLQLQLRPQPQP